MRGGYCAIREQHGSCSGTEEGRWVRGSRGGRPSHFKASENARSSISTASKKGFGHRFGQQDTQAGGTQMKFTIAIEAGTKKTAFGVVVPDLPGCFSAGDTVEEAFDNAREAIKVHCEILAEEKKDIPATKSMSEWQKDKEFKGW